MPLSKNPYKGTRDFFPYEKRVQDFIFNKMRETAESFAFEHYDGPLVEEVELYKAKSGEELINEQIYSFLDRGKRFVAIRPEMTPTLARMVSQVHREIPKPIRWYSIPNLMRYEKPQKGRLREHWQLNCDIFGAPENLGEIEILQLLVTLFNSFGAGPEQFEIKINDRRVVDAIFKTVFDLKPEQSYKLYKLIDKSQKISQEELNHELVKIAINDQEQEIFKEYLNLNSFDKLTNFLKGHNLEDSLKSINQFISLVKELDLENYVSFDSTIVRGLDYYTGLVFEVYDKHPDNRRALCGGGAYANLLKIFNEPPVTGIGFGLGDVTLTDFLKVHKLLPDLSTPKIDLFLSFQDEKGMNLALSMANQLRNSKVLVNFHPMVIKFNKVFPLAEKRGAKFVGLVGDKEALSQTIQIKSMKTKEVFILNKNASKEEIQKIFLK